MGIMKRKTNSSTPYHPSCCKTIRKFYDDFDLLPVEMKRMLQEGSLCPDFDDLRAAWDLTERNSSFADLFNMLNVYEEDRKEAERIAAVEAREREKREKLEAKRNKWANKRRGTPHYVVMTVEEEAKKQRLVQRVTAEEAVRLLSKRKENADIKPIVKHVARLVYTKEEPKKVEKPGVKYFEFSPPVHLMKALHNS